jgi:hypothetical protein
MKMSLNSIVRHLLITALTIVGLASLGCGETDSTSANAAVLPAGFILQAEPANVIGVVEAKKNARPGDRIAVRGHIGGTVNPFVNGRAIMTIVDLALPTCADKPDDCCETPWDYCCEERSDIVAHAATVQVSDETGAPLRASLRGVQGLDPMADVIVVGTVGETASPTALLIQAEAIYIKR